MPADSGLAASTPQNGVLDSLNQFTGAFNDLGRTAAGIYSSFLGARETWNLGRSQRAVVPETPEYSPANSVSALMANKGVQIGLVIAGLATAVLIYKAVK